MHVSQMHLLGKMSDEDSWALFRQRAFAKGGVAETQEFEDLGKKLVKKCNRLPLAIKTLGGLLYSKKEVHEWLSIEESDIWSSSDIYSQEGVLPSIRLSYNHLSAFSLKQCFAYCSIFPKDTRLYKEDVIRQWMAQGFLNPSRESPLQMEELGGNYFNALLSNSLLQEPTYDYKDEMYCKRHDVVHDFALLISKDYCMTMKVWQDDKNSEVVHLTLDSDKNEMVDMSQLRISRKLRTLILARGVIRNKLVKFRYLRPLILGDSTIIELPTSIDRLKQLRHINMRGTGITELPASYVNLYNLQTLIGDLEEDSKIYLGSLLNLRHIDVGGCMLVGISQLTHLRTLTGGFKVGEEKGCKIEELGPLNNLRGSLAIDGIEKAKNREEAQKANISRKTKVDHLQLKWLWRVERESSFTEDDGVIEGLKPHPYLKTLVIEEFGGSRFPSWMTKEMLKNLVELQLNSCDSCQHFPHLGYLPSLRVLSIEYCEKLVELPPISQAFLSLEQLTIMGCTALEEVDMVINGLEHLPNLKQLKIGKLSSKLDYLPWPQPHHNNTTTNEEKGEDLYFPSLKQLALIGWPRITSLPEQLQHLPSLTSLRLFYFEELKALPEWLDNIRSLQSLMLSLCSNLECMPSAREMQSLTNLREVYIEGCPRLTQGIALGSGPEWHKVAHIPIILVDGVYIQSIIQLRNMFTPSS